MKTLLTSLATIMTTVLLAAPAELKLLDDWAVQVSYDGKTGVVEIAPPEVHVVSNERHTALQDYNPKAGGWCRGTKLDGIVAMECTTRFGYCPGTLKVKSSDGADAVIYEDGKDYQLTEDWGTVGRLPEGRIGANQAVFFDYAHTLLRIDSIVQDKAGQFAVRQGREDSATPPLPALQEGDTRLANIWVKAGLKKLTDGELLPILETSFPEELRPAPGIAEALLPKTYVKLQKGEAVRILAWGDSVTVGTFLKTYPEGRWQERFVAWLRTQFPKADIQLETVAWGGRTTTSFLNEPTGSEYNYQEQVLAKKPDLIISEFVNDAGFSRDFTLERYGKLQKDFQANGMEWIILTPHYVRPDWMGLTDEKEIDQDPRAYVQALREFSVGNQVALADASLRWGRFWRQGIPYSSLMMNCINHPNEEGMALFVEALKDLFR